MSNLGTYTFKWYAWTVPWPALYEQRVSLRIRRPYPGANAVEVTGSFDNWSRSIRLDKTAEGFAKSVELPLDQKVIYKV